MSGSVTPTIARLIETLPAAAGIFRELGIDITRRDISLEEACRAMPVEAARILSLAARQADSATQAIDWSEKTLSEIVSHTVEFHHVFARECVALLSQQLTQISPPGGQKRAGQSTLEEAIGDLAAKLTVHFREEEEILFPYIIALDEADQTKRGPLAPFKSSCSPLHAIAIEHHGIMEALIAIREMIGEGHPVGIAQLVLRLGVDALDRDLREHVNLEEIVLFPRAVEVEKALCADAA